MMLLLTALPRIKVRDERESFLLRFWVIYALWIRFLFRDASGFFSVKSVDFIEGGMSV
jgi:hypothetical protein